MKWMFDYNRMIQILPQTWKIEYKVYNWCFYLYLQLKCVINKISIAFSFLNCFVRKICIFAIKIAFGTYENFHDFIFCIFRWFCWVFFCFFFLFNVSSIYCFHWLCIIVFRTLTALLLNFEFVKSRNGLYWRC